MRTTWPRLIFVHQGSVLSGLGCMLGDMPDGSMKGRELVPVPKGLAGPEGALPALPKGLTAFGAPRCWPAQGICLRGRVQANVRG